MAALVELTASMQESAIYKKAVIKAYATSCPTILLHTFQIC